MIADLLKSSPVNQRLAAELMKNMSPEEIWEVFLKDILLKQGYITLDCKNDPIDTVLLKAVLNNAIHICRFSNRAEHIYTRPSEEFKSHLINILENVII